MGTSIEYIGTGLPPRYLSLIKLSGSAEIDKISINWSPRESESAGGQRERNGHETLLLNMKDWNS